MSTAPGSRKWLFGPFPDLIFGSGLGYIAIFAIFAIGGEPLRLSHPVGFVALVSVLVSTPHYGATLLRVYERSEDRRAHLFVAVWATLLVVGLFAWSIYDAWIASWFFMVYATWSPYHYTRQNYGVGMMFLRRGGVEVSSLARNLLNASFLSSFVITFLVLHTTAEATYDPTALDYSGAVGGRSLGLPGGLGRVAMIGAWLAYGGSTVAALVMLGRGGRWRALGPTVAVVLTQALWFPLPFSVSYWGIETGLDPLDSGLPAEYVFYAAIGHAIQYQFVTAYFARASDEWRGLPLYVAKCLAAGGAIWAIPAIVFSPDLLGAREFNLGLAALVAAAVNLHHFILDGAIWKLRSQRISKVLVRSERDSFAAQVASSFAWPRRVFWAVGGLLMISQVGAIVIEQLAFPRAIAERQLARAEAELDLLRWLGRDDSGRRTTLALELARVGEHVASEEQAFRSLALQPGAEAWAVIAYSRAERDDWPGVVESYEATRALEGERPPARLSQLAMKAYYRGGDPMDARAIFQRVIGSRASGQEVAALAGVAREASDIPVAVFGYRTALDRDPGRHAAANNLAWILATAKDPEIRHPDEAIRRAEAAVASSDPPKSDYLDTLAVAFASAGRWDDAVVTATRAVSRAEAAGDAKKARSMRVQLEAYRDRAAAGGSRADD